MDIQLSNRVQRIKPSPTLAVSARATELKAQGKDIIDLGVGEPDFDTPEHIKQSGIKAIQEGFTKYTAVDGTAGLKQAIIEKFSRDNGLEYKPNQILVSCGGKQSFFNLCQAFINDGDEVIIPAPYWVSYPDMVVIADGTPVFITADIKQNYKITPEQLEKAITPKTRLFVINSPSNPTGVAYTKAELTALAKVLLKHPQVLVATDDMYEHILWAKEPFVNILNVCPELYDRTIVLNGVSKAYSMTGWRIGYAGGPAKLIAAMKNVQSQSTSNPTSISQKAAEFALKSDQDSIKEMIKAFKERHDFVYNRLKSIPGVECVPADGAFYLFPNMQKVIDQLPNIHNDVEFTEHVLMTVGVALVPGSAFGAPGCVRLSIATSMNKLEDALNRIEKVISGKNS